MWDGREGHSSWAHGAAGRQGSTSGLQQQQKQERLVHSPKKTTTTTTTTMRKTLETGNFASLAIISKPQTLGSWQSQLWVHLGGGFDADTFPIRTNKHNLRIYAEALFIFREQRKYSSADFCFAKWRHLSYFEYTEGMGPNQVAWPIVYSWQRPSCHIFFFPHQILHFKND